MTKEEQALADDKMRAEIAKLTAEIANLGALNTKLAAETMKLNTENRWYLLVVGSGATLAIVAIVKLFM